MRAATSTLVVLMTMAGNTLPVAAIGAAMIYFSTTLVPFGIGLGVLAYAGAVAFYTLLATWRLRRAADRPASRWHRSPILFSHPAAVKKSLSEAYACEGREPEDK